PLTVISASAENGTVTINDDGTLHYIPEQDLNGADAISYGLNDGQGRTDTAIVTVTVNPVNDPPVANDDAVSTDEDVAIDIDVLRSEERREGKAWTAISASAEKGTVTINDDGTLHYMPEQDFNGTATISNEI